MASTSGCIRKPRRTGDLQLPALSYIVLSPSFSKQALEAPSLAIAAAKAGATGVIDAECEFDADAVLSSFQLLVKHGAHSGKVGLRIPLGKQTILAKARLDACGTISGAASDSSAATRPESFVAILTPGTEAWTRDSMTSMVRDARNAGFEALVEAVSISEGRLAQELGADGVIAKGHEAGGRIGDTTAFVLMQQFAREITLPTWVQGGIGLHSAAAASVGGARGVVLDSQLYLCRDSQLDTALKQKLEKLDGTEPSTSALPHGQLFRSLAIAEAACSAGESPALPIGQDACLARSLARIGGTVSGALAALSDSVEEQLEIARRAAALAPDSPLAKSHGTKYPVVQGAMTRVSDTSAFAHSVAKGGALPFLALSLMRGSEIDKLLTETRSELGSLPWGVGLLGFVPQKLRQEQWDVVNKHKPPFALIAGGRPDQAKALEDAGTKTYLHVPSPLLLESFIDMGSKRFIFEGKECGGHVGPRSSMVLWESMIEILLRHLEGRQDASEYHVLFAGGIHDDLSAAMVAAFAAPLTARGIKVGVLLGTAYLFTREAVDSGAIVEKFQEEALKCDETVLLETGPGHSIRCINSPYKETFDQRRRELENEKRGRDEIREELEMMNLGRLRIASKGLTRNGGTELSELPAAQQWQEGMYMIGQVASLRNERTTVEELHESVSTQAQSRLERLKQSAESSRARTSSVRPCGEPIAIVGMSCLFPKANDLESYWQNILNKVDCIGEIPETHFDWKQFYDKDPLARDRIVSKWGGFLQDIVFEPSRYGIPPSSLESIDPMQVLILEAARTALLDAGYSERRYPRDKSSVILANAGHGPITALYSLRSMLGWKLSNLDDGLKRDLEGMLPEWTEDSFAGYLGNVTAGRVANRFDLKGVNFSIDAACASSLAALYVAVSDLRSGASDVVLLGATDTHNQPGDYLSFSKTHALSADGRCKTFDASADGIVISEGIAMLVLKRLKDAERDGDRIYAVIRGIGGSSDGRDLSLTAPRPAGQMLALQRAYVDAGVEPATVGLVEAHGTGTVAGDKAEVEALTNVFSQNGASSQSCAIGSVKTNIGHTKAAAGLASLIKVAKALHHKVLPPTMNVVRPNPACNFEASPFYINNEIRPWLTQENQLRRAAVSAFGFGGTNFHTILEEYTPPCAVDEAPVVMAWPVELFIWKARSFEQLIKLVSQAESAAKAMLEERRNGKATGEQERSTLFDLASKAAAKSAEDNGTTLTLTVLAADLSDLLAKLKQFKEAVTQASLRCYSAPGIRFAPEKQQAKVAYLFPGQGSQKLNMLRELSLYFPEIAATFAEANDHFGDRFGKPLSNFVFPTPTFDEQQRKQQQIELTHTAIAQPAIGVANLSVLRLLSRFGVKPDMVAGHSYGEYVALYAAGAVDAKDLLRLSAERGRVLAECAARNPGSMAAVAASESLVASVISGIEGVYLANLNTPEQCIISGTKDGIEAAIAQFVRRDIVATKIPVSAAFHSPLMNEATDGLRAMLDSTRFSSPQVPVWTNTTGEQLPDTAAGLSKHLEEHALKPVFFARQLQSMHSAGARIFVEVGPGNLLTKLAETTLAGKDFTALHVEHPKRALEQVLDVLAVLAVNDSSVDLRRLFWNRAAAFMQQADEKPKKNKLLYKVNSVRMERIGVDKQEVKKVAPKAVTMPAVAAPVQPPALPKITGGTSKERVMMQFQQSMLEMTNRFLETQQNVMLAYLQSNGGASNMPALPQSTLAAQGIAGEPDAPATRENYPTEPPQINDSSEAKPGEATAEAPCAVSSLIDSLYEIVSDRTGYPREMLDPALDMEADLGIDSIKRVEILNNFRKLLPQTVQDELETGIEKLAGTKTLQGVIDWIESLDLQGAQSDNRNGTAAGIAAPGASNNGTSSPLKGTSAADTNIVVSGDANKIARGVIERVVLDRPTTARDDRKLTVLAVTSASTAAIAETTAALLRAEGHQVRIIDEASLDGLADAVTGSLSALLYFGDAGPQAYFKVIKSIEATLLGAAKLGRASVINVTQLGGDFGMSAKSGLSLEALTRQAGCVGLSKTIAKEWLDVHVKTVDFGMHASSAEISAGIAAELFAEDSIVEIGYHEGKRIGLDIKRATYAEQVRRTDLQLNSSSVILVTGGARGITAEITQELAKHYRPTFVIVGRSPRPAEREDATTAAFTSAKDLKAALIERDRAQGKPVNLRDVERAYQNLMRDREIRRTLQELERLGSTARYYSVDVSDRMAFGNFLDSLYETMDLDGVIHGAGIIEDALIKDKTIESFERVYRTKVESTLTLASKLRFNSLKFLFLFSSIVGRTGNAGQADYVAANEALNKLAVALQAKAQCRVASLMWGPWQAGMAPPELEEVFARHGWSMIQPADGRACFMEELQVSSGEPEVMLVGKLTKAPKDCKAVGPALRTALVEKTMPVGFTLDANVEDHLYLQDHQFDGIPVMPMAMALEMMLEAANSVQPGKVIRRVCNMDIPSGIVFHSGRKELAVTADVDGNSTALVLSSLSPSRKMNFRCTAEYGAPALVRGTYTSKLGSEIPAAFDPQSLPVGERSLPQPDNVYGKWLFHGPIFQGLKKVIWMSPVGICGEVEGKSPGNCISTADRDNWILDPILLDSALQLAGVWARHYQDVTVLPAGFKKLELLAPIGKRAIGRVFLTEALANELLCDLAIYNEDNQLCAVIEGLAGIASKAFNRFSASQPAVKELV